MQYLMYACGVVSLVCWIMVLIKMFKDNVVMGIIGILCGLFAFIYGWVKVKEYQVKNVMLVWTIAIVGQIVFGVMGGMSALSSMSSQ
jgi:tellurite resistance protein TehA-like permease